MRVPTKLSPDDAYLSCKSLSLSSRARRGVFADGSGLVDFDVRCG